jgi:AcrR family transcriptional regulator
LIERAVEVGALVNRKHTSQPYGSFLRVRVVDPTLVVTTQRRPQEQRTLHTRSELVAAAVHCINEVGYARATTREIAQYARLSTGALQYQFGGKDALMLAVIVDMRARLATALGPAHDALSRPVGERVGLLIEQYWSVVSGAEYQAVMQIMLGVAVDSAVHREITEALDVAEHELDRHWTASFADLDRESDDLVNSRRVMLGALRGFALRRLHRERDPAWAGERRLLADMTCQWLLE